MDTRYLATKNILFSIVNKGESETSDYSIAYYLLSHYNDIRNITIKDMSEKCFVDRSTIRRFFVKYGYENFLDFKKHYCDQLEDRYRKVLPFENYNEYIVSLNRKISDMMEQYTLKRDKTQDIDSVIQRLYASHRIVLLGDESFYGNMYTVQQYLLTMGKVVFVLTSNLSGNPILHSLDRGDCLLVFSLKGNYLGAIADEIRHISCQKILLTLSGRPAWPADFDYVARLTSDPEKVDEEIYRRYAVTYYIDIMLNTYRMKYGKK